MLLAFGAFAFRIYQKDQALVRIKQLGGVVTVESGLLREMMPNRVHIQLKRNQGIWQRQARYWSRRLEAIDSVWFFESPVEDEDMKVIRALRPTAHVSLYKSNVSDAGLAHLSGLTDLEILNLNGTKITDAGLVHLRGMRKLRYLDLSGTEIDGDGLAYLQNLTAPLQLTLSGSKISDESLVHLKAIGNLDKLYLSLRQLLIEGSFT